MKITWAFVDYENIHSLKLIDLSTYAKIIVFLGHQQSFIDLGPSKYPNPISLEVITVMGNAQNNLDFHLAYYLGLYDSHCPENIAFDIITKDKGFSLLLKHINTRGRTCRHIAPEAISGYDKIVSILTSKTIKNKPKKIESLRNFIGSQMQCQNNDIAIQSGINHLLKAKVIEIENNHVKYVQK